MRNWYKHGSWNVLCDRCGFKFKAEDVRKDWQGLYVCHSCFEPRHPQDFLRGVEEKAAPAYIRDEPEDIFVEVCYPWDRSCYADLASADCALADNQQLTYAYLLALKNGT
jgi:hypothetical protein